MLSSKFESGHKEVSHKTCCYGIHRVHQDREREREKEREREREGEREREKERESVCVLDKYTEKKKESNTTYAPE